MVFNNWRRNQKMCNALNGFPSNSISRVMKQIKSNGLHLCLKSDKESMPSSSSLLKGDEETHVAYMVRKTMMKNEKLSIRNIK